MNAELQELIDTGSAMFLEIIEVEWKAIIAKAELGYLDMNTIGETLQNEFAQSLKFFLYSFSDEVKMLCQNEISKKLEQVIVDIDNLERIVEGK
jgi:hypothetical protein